MDVKRGKILIIDDEPKVRRFMEISLMLRGFHVESLSSGIEALANIDTIQPDLIILDIMMPDMDGIEVLRQLRRISHIPVIAFSASETNKINALLNGADAFITKPFYPEMILDDISELIDRSKNRKPYRSD